MIICFVSADWMTKIIKALGKSNLVDVYSPDGNGSLLNWGDFFRTRYTARVDPNEDNGYLWNELFNLYSPHNVYNSLGLRLFTMSEILILISPSILKKLKNRKIEK